MELWLVESLVGEMERLKDERLDHVKEYKWADLKEHKLVSKRESKWD